MALDSWFFMLYEIICTFCQKVQVRKGTNVPFSSLSPNEVLFFSFSLFFPWKICLSSVLCLTLAHYTWRYCVIAFLYGADIVCLRSISFKCNENHFFFCLCTHNNHLTMKQKGKWLFIVSSLAFVTNSWFEFSPSNLFSLQCYCFKCRPRLIFPSITLEFFSVLSSVTISCIAISFPS